MMPVSNRFNLPDVVVKALTVDTYSRGNSDISITTLIDSPRIGILQKEHDGEIEQDAVDFLWSRFGTSVHNMFEDAAEGDAQTWKLSHKKAFGVSELAVVEKMVEGIELLASAAAQLPALPSR